MDTKEGLIDWAACQSAVGVLLDTAARSEIVTLINEYDADPWNKGDDGTARSGKDRLKDAVDQARTTAGQHVASSAGTEFHKLGELINRGVEPRIVQDHLKPKLEHYRESVKPIKFLRQELFIVNDRLQLAGSCDYLVELPPGIRTPDGVLHDEPMVCSADLKSGRWDFRFPMGVTCQVAVYGTGVIYDQATNTRSPIHERMNTKWGLMLHYPIMTPDSTVKFYWLDLELGVEAAALGRDVEAMKNRFKRKENGLKELVFA